MAGAEETTASASRNGHQKQGLNGTAPASGESDAPQERSRSLLERAVRAVAGQVQQRIPPADLDERAPDYIRESLPRLWLLASLYFRGEVRGLGNIPDEGPVLLVGNHSGGNLTPDTSVFTLAFSAYFGVERRFH